MQYWAYLHTAPVDLKNNRTFPTRLDKLRSDRRDPTFFPPMPDVGGHDELLQYLWMAGPVVAGSQALTHLEIRAWQDNTGVELDGWQAQTLRDLSNDYAVQVELARNPNCPSPYLASPHIDRKTVARDLQKMMSSLMRAQKPKGKRHESRKSGNRNDGEHGAPEQGRQ